MGKVTITTEEYDNFKELQRMVKEEQPFYIYFPSGNWEKYIGVSHAELNEKLQEANSELKKENEKYQDIREFFQKATTAMLEARFNPNKEPKKEVKKTFWQKLFNC